MLFALYDYCKYRLRLGKYSDKFLRDHDFLPADKEYFTDLSQLTAGCVFFYHAKNSFISWLVMYYTNSYVSHCANFVENGFLIDCTLQGVIKHPFTDYLDGRGYICIKTPRGLTDEAAREISQTAHRFVGKPYDWKGALNLGLFYILGRQESFRISCILDFLTVLLPVMLLSYKFAPALFWIEGIIFLGYASLVGFTRCLKKYPKMFFAAIKCAANLGNSSAQTNLGSMYANGLLVTRDFGEALKWYKLAADKGCAGAQNNIGNMYINGHGVSQDYGEAIKWYKLAADQGYFQAQINLFRMYVAGKGVPLDYVEAVKWYNMAMRNKERTTRTKILSRLVVSLSRVYVRLVVRLGLSLEFLHIKKEGEEDSNDK